MERSILHLPLFPHLFAETLLEGKEIKALTEKALLKKKYTEWRFLLCTWFFQAPMQLVAPRAVSIAVAIDAIIWTMNLMVSFFVMVLIGFKWLLFSV